MSIFNFDDFIGPNQEQTEQPVIQPIEQPVIQPIEQPVIQEDLAANIETERYFDLNNFLTEVYNKDIEKNHNMIQNQKYMSAYDISSGCIQNIINKIRNVPVRNYSSKWLPIVLRSYLGNSVHDFIQENSNQFTEKEISIKVPEINFSGRIDCLINNDVIVEIKSLPYNDYRKIIKTKSPRTNDVYQTLVYKYILENYLEQSKNHNENTRTQKPILNNYNIKYIQFIYVAHDIMASDIESLDEAIQSVQHVKKVLNSKHNTFYFMCNLLINLDECDVSPHLTYIKNKIERVNYYLANNLNVKKDDEFVDTKACFFCLYSDSCPFK